MFEILNCNSENFEHIERYIKRFELDNRSLMPEQFLTIHKNNELIGFGRIREHAGCSELCSLGIIEPERNKGAGTVLTKQLMLKAIQPLYLVCIIPSFFEPLGFEVCTEYPDAIADKLKYCNEQLPVSEQYVAMKAVNKNQVFKSRQ